MDSARVALVTGAAGFLGGYIASNLVQHGWTVIGVDQVMPATFAGHSFYKVGESNSSLREIVSIVKPSDCVHCAGSASVPLSMVNPLHDFHLNTSLTAEVLESIRVYCPDCRMVLLSSAAVYGSPEKNPIRESTHVQPISSYGYHKYLAEQLCSEYSSLHGARTAVVRIFSAYGEGLRRQVLWDLCSRMTANKELILQGTGEETRDFIHARDVAKGVRLVIEQGRLAGECYNLASGAETKIFELAKTLQRGMNKQMLIKFDGILPPGVPTRWRADIERIRALGFQPEIGIESGALGYAKWARTELASR